MITGMSHGPKSILDALKESKFEFVLTGSRYFGNYNENSDYDFMVEDDGRNLEDFLYGLGARVLFQKGEPASNYPEYADQGIRYLYLVEQKGEIPVHIQVLQKEIPTVFLYGTRNRGKDDYYLAKNSPLRYIEVKQKAQELIEKYKLYTVGKADRKIIWQAMTKLVVDQMFKTS